MTRYRRGDWRRLGYGQRLWALEAEALISFVLGALALIVLAVALIWNFFPVTASGEVIDHDWERTIQVERWQENQHSDWDVPAGGRTISKDWRYRRTDTYTCGTETYIDSDGEPARRTKYCTTEVYDWWYTYAIWEWTPNRVLRAAGGWEAEPRWPDDTDLEQRQPNPERTAARRETYTTVMQAGRVTYVYQSDQATWSRLTTGMKVRIEAAPSGHVWRVTKPDGSSI